MSPELEDWKSKGQFISFGHQQLKLFVLEFGDSSASPDDTLLILHGFPESSYSFQAVIDSLATRFKRIVLFDMLGYGMSDKPETGYSYSLIDQADSAFHVWNHFGVKGGHLLSHDMGISVATEIIARYNQGFMPNWFSEGFKSLTLTNGSMVLELAALRSTQKILLSKYGKRMSGLTSYKLFKQQVTSAHGNDRLTEEQLKLFWELNTLQKGNRKSYLTIHYLRERLLYEKTRWLPALSKLKIPIHLCWGDLDQVARIEMAYYLKEHIIPNADFTIMKGLGHFCQMGSPEEWSGYILAWYKGNQV